MKSWQHLFGSNSSALTLTVASRRFSCVVFLAFVLLEDTGENILSISALLTGVIRQVRAKVASYLTLSLLMSYIYGAPCKVRNFVLCIWTYV
jgi:hypothetical protein